MNDFKLPIIKGTNPRKRVLSMDEYLKFVQFNLKHAFDRRTHRKRKKMIAVNVPFSMTG